jgi:Phage portal protein, SPP1 Gp6-like
MAYQLNQMMSDEGLGNPAELGERIEKLLNCDGLRYRRLWAYYRNPMRACGVASEEQGAERPYRQAQEWGLPSRITGVRSGLEMFCGALVDGVARKEVVIENDIGWRIDTMVDYLFGKPIVINSAAGDPKRRAIIEELLRQILAHNGGIVFLQQLALLGTVYGFIDVLVKFSAEDSGLGSEPKENNSVVSAQPAVLSGPCGTTELGQPPAEKIGPALDGSPPSVTKRDAGGSSSHVATAGPESGDDESGFAGASNISREALGSLARRIRLEIVEPARALPLLSAGDYRCVKGYAQVYQVERGKNSATEVAPPVRIGGSIIDRIRARFGRGGNFGGARRGNQTVVVEIITAQKWQRYEDEVLVAEGNNSLGRVPLVHVQNSAIPFEYSGVSDVEPLIPIQDELNARLSDRAYRITMQAFKMYLGKGIENFTEMPVSPGRMWLTDNENASIEEFGGDAKADSEDSHISDVREAMDKISSVTPIAAGAIKSRIGNLTSAAALRVTMLALLAKTERKRTAYGPAIEQMCELALAWLDRAGLFATTPDERRIEINWPSPLPESGQEQLQEAQTKLQIGVPREVVLRELGY